MRRSGGKNTTVGRDLNRGDEAPPARTRKEFHRRTLASVLRWLYRHGGTAAAATHRHDAATLWVSLARVTKVAEPIMSSDHLCPFLDGHGK
jgi:hypothetical protein